MCLLKPNERANNCTHEECKHAQMLNRPSCIYNPTPASKLTNIPMSANFAQQLQNQQKSLFQTVQIPENVGLPFVNCPKDILRSGLDDNLEDEEVFTLNKKKVKLDNGSEARPINLAQDYQTKNYIVNPNLQQFVINNNTGDKMLFNNPQLNNILTGGTPNNNNALKADNMQFMQVNQPFYVPYMQNGQSSNNGMNQNIVFMPYQQNMQQAMPQQSMQQSVQSPFQNFAQNIKIKPTMSFESSISPSANSGDNLPRDNNSSGFNVEEFMKGVQNKVVDLLFAQNKMLIDLREKNELVQDTLACLINEVNSLKQVVKQNNSEKSNNKLEQIAILPHMLETSREIATSETLLNHLYGPKQDFQYQIVFKNELSLPLYRERNFKFTVLLTDKDGNPVKNSNRIPLTLAIYTSENPPKFVDVNTSGNKILKGMIDKDLVDGSVTFDKIQIKEVTSHFRNGWVFFVVYPKATMTLNPLMAGANTLIINSNQIKPLVLEKVVVKAKRSKEKEEKDEKEERDQEMEQLGEGDDTEIYEPEQ